LIPEAKESVKGASGVSKVIEVYLREEVSKKEKIERGERKKRRKERVEKRKERRRRDCSRHKREKGVKQRSIR